MPLPCLRLLTQRSPDRHTPPQIEHTSAQEGGRGPPLLVEYVHVLAGSVSRRVSIGDTVTCGQPVAEVGQAGFCPKPHLHIEAHRERHPKAPSIPIAFTFAAGQSDEEDANAVVPVAGGWYEAGVGRVSPPPRPDPNEPVEAAAGSSRSRRAEDPTRRRPGRSIASMASLDATQKGGRRARDEDEVTAVFDY